MLPYKPITRFALGSVVLFWLLVAPATPSHGEAKKDPRFPRQILIIRHAEKTGEKDDQHLSKKGKERTDVLHQLFAAKSGFTPFPRPDFIFAARNKQESHRPVETVAPLAAKLKLAVNDKYTSKSPTKNDAKTTKDMFALRDELFGQPQYFGKTILVSWRHSTIPELARALKADKAPAKWQDDVFDRVWQINYDIQGRATFQDRPQRLLPGDAEK